MRINHDNYYMLIPIYYIPFDIKPKISNKADKKDLFELIIQDFIIKTLNLGS